MRRRRTSGTDSLELLLDTICNTFGGVLFIAILVVILLQLSGNSSEPQNTPTSGAQVTSLQLQLESLLNEKNRLQELVFSQEETLMRLAPKNLKQQLESRSQQSLLRDQLEQKIEAAQRQLQSTAQTQKELEQKTEQFASQIREMKVANQGLEDKIEQEQQVRTTELRTTEVRDPGLKRQVIAVLQYGRFYLWHEYDSRGERVGLNMDDFLILDDSTTGVETTPNPLRGTPLNQEGETRLALQRQLRQFNPNEFYLAIVVRPDSFGSFRNVRETLSNLGMEYQLLPSTQDEGYVDRGGSGGRVQ